MQAKLSYPVCCVTVLYKYSVPVVQAQSPHALVKKMHNPRSRVADVCQADAGAAAVATQNPVPHVSLAWAPGDQTQVLQQWLDSFDHLPVALAVSSSGQCCGCVPVHSAVGRYCIGKAVKRSAVAMLLLLLLLLLPWLI
jgi:hypothetical protein